MTQKATPPQPSDSLTDAVLLVDDNPTNLQVLYRTLTGEGYRLLVAKSGEDALAIASKTRPLLVLLDIMMPGLDGYETCRRLKEDPLTRHASVIFLSALDDTAAKVRGLEMGAVDFISKPFQAEEVIARVRTHLTIQRQGRQLRMQKAQLEHELRVAQTLLKEAKQRVDGPLLGDSSAVRGLREAVKECAQAADPVLLIGPPGAGQEAIARAIHHQSERGRSAFIQVNCANLQTSRNSSLFAAHQGEGGPRKEGKFQLAEEGTLYLEAINELPPEMQKELLEVLEKAQESRSAGLQPSPDVRLIASGNLRIEVDARDGRFDPRLHQAVSRRQVAVPALAARRQDIPALAQYFVERYALKLGRSIEGISSESMQKLQEYHWPGNIQELSSLLERSVLSATGPRIEVDPSGMEAGIPIGRYRLVEKLGAGGMGEVWRARHEMLARPVAVKLIHPHASEDSKQKEILVRRFQREAQTTAALQSPNTVELYDFGVSETGAFYFVMELLNGIDLEAMVRKFGPLPPERAVMLLRQACRSLQEAHQAGLIHRDIKPANLVACKLGPEYDFLKILDFGIVKAPSNPEHSQLTAADTISGTPAYLPPEIILGKESIDGRADLYSLGCVAYWLLTGQMVFDSPKPIEVLMQHVQASPVAPSKRSEVPISKELDEIVLSCLHKSPQQRPASASHLWRLLGEAGLETEWSQSKAHKWWRSHLPDSAAQP